MAELTLRVNAEYSSAIACRRELDEVIKKMKELNENSSPQEIEALTKRYAELTAKYESSMSFVGKTFAYIKEAVTGVNREVKLNIDRTKDLGNSQKDIIENAEKRLQLEEGITDTLKKQRAEIDKERSVAGQKHNTNIDAYNKKYAELDTKYGGQPIDAYSKEDREELEKLEESVKASYDAFDDLNTKVEVYDQLIDESVGRTEKLKTTIDGVNNIYKGFADTVESSTARIFISEDVFRRYNELSDTINNLKREITDIGNSDNIDIPLLEGKQEELREAQEELRALDEAARHTGEILGENLAERVSVALNKLYNLNESVRMAQGEFDELSVKLEKAKKELSEASDPEAITKARQEVDNLQFALDEASDKLSKFKMQQKDALSNVEKMSRSIGGESEGSGQNITGEVSAQVKGVMRNIAAIAGMGIGLREVKEFFDKAKEWRTYFQDIESSMKVFLGSAEKGTEFTEKLQKYAYYNMFEFSDLAAASQQMISYGHDVESIIPRLDQLSNVATGTHGSLMELVDAYNRAKATGVVDARGVQSWAIKGVMIRDVLRDLGETTAGTTITFEQLNKVLDHVTAEGGQFHNLMGEMMNNISAEAGQLEDNLSLMFNEVGEKYESVFIKFLKIQSDMAGNRGSFISDEALDFGVEALNNVLDELAEHWKEIVSVIKSAAVAFGTFKAVMIAHNAYMAVADKYTKLATLGYELNTAGVTKNTLVKELNKAATQASTAAEVKETVTEAAGTAATNAETAAEIANTAAKKTNTTATITLSNAWKGLTASMMANPWVLAAAAIAGLAYVCYSAYDAMMTQERAQRMLNDVTEEYKEKQETNTQEAQGYISTIQSTTASLIEQTEAYRNLTKQMAIFEKFKKEDIANMSKEQIDRLINENNKQNDEDRLRHQLEAAETILARRQSGEENLTLLTTIIDEVISKYDDLDGFGEKLKDEYSFWFNNSSEYMKSVIQASSKELQDYLSNSASSGIVEGVTKGVSNPEIRENMSNVLGQYSEIVSNEIKGKMADIARFNELEEKKEKKGLGVEEWKEYPKLKQEVEAIRDNLSKTSSELKTNVKEQVAQATKRFTDLNEEMTKVTGTKKTELEVKVKEAQNEMDTWRAISHLIESGTINTEIVVDVKRNFDNETLGDEKLVEIGEDYKKIDDIAQEVANRVTDTKKAYDDLEDKSHTSLEQMLEDAGLTAEGIDEDFSAAQEHIGGEIEELKRKLLSVKPDTEEARKIELEIQRKQEQLNYIDQLKSNLKALIKDPFNIRVNIAAIIPEDLRKIFKKVFGIELGSKEVAHITTSEQAQQEGHEAQTRIDDKKKTGPEKKTGAQWKAEERKALLERKKELEALLKTPITQKEAEQYQKELDQINNALKKGGAGAKEILRKRAQAIRDAFAKEEEMVKLKREADDARIDAETAAIRNAGERERAERAEQHRRTLRDLELQTDEIYKEIYERRKKEWENSHKDSPYELTAEGRKGYGKDEQGNYVMTLSAEEKKYFDLRQSVLTSNADKEISNRNRVLDEQRKAEKQAYLNFLKDYGTYEQQRYAIMQEWAEKRKELTDPFEIAAGEAKMQQDLENLDNGSWKDNIDWEGIFNNLEGHTKGYLEGLRTQLQDLLASGKITDIDDMAVVQEKISEINQLIAQQGGFFSNLSPLMMEYNRRLEAEQNARARLEQARQNEAEAKNKYDTLMSGIFGEDAENFNPMGADFADKVKEFYGAESDEYKKALSQLPQLIAAEQDLTDARKDTKTATDKLENAEDANNKTLKDKWAGTVESITTSKTYENVSGVPDLLKGMGLGDMGDKAQKGLDGFNDSLGAVTDFMSGNYVGAAMKAVSAITNFGEALGAWSNSNRAEVEADNKRLTEAMNVNTEAINRLTDVMQKGSAFEAFDIYEQQKALMEMNEKNAKEKMLGYAHMYDGGRSLNYDLDDANGVIDKIYKLLNKSGYNTDLDGLIRAMSGADWNTLFETKEGQELMRQLANAISGAEDEGNYNGIFKDILDFAANYSDEAYGKLIDNLREKVTGISFDSMYNSFVSNLMNMDKSAESFAEDFEGYIRTALYQGLADKMIKDELKKWQGAWAYYWNNDKKLDKTEINRLMHEGGTYEDENGEKVEYKSIDAMKGIAENIRNSVEVLGLYNGKNGQTATMNSISNISYDQADSMEGTLIAQLIVQEQIKALLEGMGMDTKIVIKKDDIVTDDNKLDLMRDAITDFVNPEDFNLAEPMIEQRDAMISLLEAMPAQLMPQASEQRDISADSRDILAGMAIHVEEIRDGVVDTIVPRIKNIDTNLTKVYKLVEAQ